MQYISLWLWGSIRYLIKTSCRLFNNIISQYCAVHLVCKWNSPWGYYKRVTVCGKVFHSNASITSNWLQKRNIGNFGKPQIVPVAPTQKNTMLWSNNWYHDVVIKWKHFPRYWPFVRGIHRSPVNSPHKGQWCGALMFTLICARINGWVNNREAGDLRRHRAHYDVIVMLFLRISSGIIVAICDVILDCTSKRNECLGRSGHMLTSRNGNIFWVNGAFWGESTGHRCIPPKESSDAELRMMFLWCVPEQTVEQM